MFGLFKDKKKELAKEIYGVFKPKIEFVKITGKLGSNLSIGDVLIGDDYLLGFLNTYISFACREFGYTGQDAGLIMLDVYELLDKTYGDIQKQQQYFEALKKATKKNTCAVLLEVVQGEGGVNVPDHSYLLEVQEWCHENNILFMKQQ